eukprot:Polyplicarium_translucidae@DN2737_c0_g1_i2.p1
MLPLPLNGPLATENKKGVFEKIMKNRTDTAPAEAEVQSVVDALVTPAEQLRKTGFVYVVAESVHEEKEERSFRPVCGSVVLISLEEPSERNVCASWSRRSLEPHQAAVINKALALRVIHEALEFKTPGKKCPRKLVSIKDVHMSSFPREMRDFLVTDKIGVTLSQHYEDPHSGGSHEDKPNAKCTCGRLSSKPDSWIFWGITDTRFLSRAKRLQDEIFASEALVGRFGAPREKTEAQSPRKRGLSLSPSPVERKDKRARQD